MDKKGLVRADKFTYPHEDIYEHQLMPDSGVCLYLALLFIFVQIIRASLCLTFLSRDIPR